MILADTFKNADVLLASGETVTGAAAGAALFELLVEGATASLVNPGEGGVIEVGLGNLVVW